MPRKATDEKSERKVEVLVNNLYPSLYQRGQVLAESEAPEIFANLDRLIARGCVRLIEPTEEE